tara:strand:+ start:456 stop:779 length:324 start_codon:yes stop_codon:yes gene_type:complete
MRLENTKLEREYSVFNKDSDNNLSEMIINTIDAFESHKLAIKKDDFLRNHPKKIRRIKQKSGFYFFVMNIIQFLSLILNKGINYLGIISTCLSLELFLLPICIFIKD